MLLVMNLRRETPKNSKQGECLEKLIKLGLLS